MFNYGGNMYLLYVYIICNRHLGKYTLFSIKVENLLFLFVFV
jgi:hypothetical protein